MADLSQVKPSLSTCTGCLQSLQSTTADSAAQRRTASENEADTFTYNCKHKQDSEVSEDCGSPSQQHVGLSLIVPVSETSLPAAVQSSPQLCQSVEAASSADPVVAGDPTSCLRPCPNPFEIKLLSGISLTVLCDLFMLLREETSFLHGQPRQLDS